MSFREGLIPIDSRGEEELRERVAADVFCRAERLAIEFQEFRRDMSEFYNTAGPGFTGVQSLKTTLETIEPKEAINKVVLSVAILELWVHKRIAKLEMLAESTTQALKEITELCKMLALRK